LHRRRGTTRQVWHGARPGAETALVLGTLRRRGTLDAILRAYSTRKLPLLKRETLAVLRVALFELLFMSDAPAHAVVHAAVENVKGLGRPQDLGFVNALLRGILRSRRRGKGGDPRHTLPVDADVVLFHRAVFPAPESQPAAYLAARGSTAPWLARRRLEELGFARALRCLDLQAATPRTHLRPAPDQMTATREALTAAGIPWEEGPHDALVTVPARVRAEDILAACGRWVVFQDAVAAQVAPFLAPAPGARVLDFCAAPGGKATHLAQLVGPTGHVSAWDADAARLERVLENAARLGLAQLHCEPPAGEYDAVLADVPCSNTGVLARRPEARWRVKERHLPGLAQRQLRILKDAAAHLRRGGGLVYATCSLEQEENTAVVAAFLAARTGFALEAERTLYPDETAGDGGFMARLRRL
jgi:16S rRNA (cytosine967-C5)-methyltransferase